MPGSSLSQVIIWDLPFPPHDPVFDSFRRAADDAFLEVDLPYMLLRIRQGIGRLIRTADDQCDVVIFFEKDSYTNYAKYIKDVLPRKVETIQS